MPKTLDRSKGVEDPRRWEETIRNAMFQMTNDELVRFLLDNPFEARRWQACLKRATVEGGS
jgi:hypothetical protein